MEDSKVFTPQKLPKKGAGTVSSASIGKQALAKDSRNNYMPSRYISDKPANKNIPQELLHSTLAVRP